MKTRIQLAFFLLVSLSSANAMGQWRHITLFGGSNLPVVYFLDKFGKPETGFASSEAGVEKTTDGGFSWKNVFSGVLNPDDLVFMDSLTGWVSTEGTIIDGSTYSSCFKTTDGGESWFPLGNGENPAQAVYYDSISDGLFLSTYGGLDPLDQCELSWDRGATWVPFVSNYGISYGGFAFVNGDTGVLTWFTNEYTPLDWEETQDGGHTWLSLAIDTPCWQPLAIPGTSTFFVNTLRGSILRSDDAGESWRTIYQFPSQDIHYISGLELSGATDSIASSGCIRGTLDSMFVMLCTGCYLSTDQGLSWSYLCGVPDIQYPVQRFYLDSRKLYVFGNDSNPNPTLWILNLDSLNIVYSNYAEQFPNGLKQQTITAGDTVRVDYLSDTALGPQVGVDSVLLTISYDTNTLSLVRFELDSGWSIKDSTYSAGTYHLLLVDSDSLGLAGSTRLLRADFESYLTNTVQSKVYLDSVHFFGHRLNCDCSVSSILSVDTSAYSFPGAIDSVEVDFSGCADSLLLAVMNGGQIVFNIESIQPNPASGNITASLTRQTVSPISYELYDALGSQQSSGSIASDQTTLDVSSLPSGIYYLRFSSEGYVQTRSISIQR
jgi:Secretion system C-terminal sorting domain